MGGADKKRGEDGSATKPQRASGISVRRDFLLNNTLRYWLSINEVRKEKQKKHIERYSYPKREAEGRKAKCADSTK